MSEMTAATTPDFFSQSKETLAQIVALVDPELRFISDQHPGARTCRTLLVDQGGQKRVLKVRRISHNLWDDTYFRFEVDALKRVAERKLKNVTLMLKHYKNESFEAILKTFVEGTPCNQLDVDELLTNREFIRKLDRLYLQLHLAGISKILFLPRKVVIDNDGELTLVDLSTCIVNTEYGTQRFAQEMIGDSHFITRLERRATH
jgi:hypothetical protein